MDIPSSKRQDKRDSKKKKSANSVYTSKHVRIAAAVAEKSSKPPAKSKTPSKK
jgi:hypothetical protein